MSLHDEVVRVLDARPPNQGVIVSDATGQLLAARDPIPGGSCVLVVLDAEPFAYPTPRGGSATRPPRRFDCEG